jgi:hypothetical protein
MKGAKHLALSALLTFPGVSRLPTSSSSCKGWAKSPGTGNGGRARTSCKGQPHTFNAEFWAGVGVLVYTHAIGLPIRAKRTPLPSGFVAGRIILRMGYLPVAENASGRWRLDLVSLNL